MTINDKILNELDALRSAAAAPENSPVAGQEYADALLNASPALITAARELSEERYLRNEEIRIAESLRAENERLKEAERVRTRGAGMLALRKENDTLRADNEQLRAENDRLRKFVCQLAQWDAQKISIVPSIALKHYAKAARAALEEK
jgi:hypothetical protein